MLRVARAYIADNAVAEEIVQGSLLRVLRSIDRFEARSILKAWVFRIPVNTALNGLAVNGAALPSPARGREAGEQQTVEPERFRPADPLR
jgi:RNA polymerase sigma-70 factor (ECF subfamily)